MPSRLALGARCSYSQRCWGSPVRQKKKHTGNQFDTFDMFFLTLHRRQFNATDYRLNFFIL